jgi:hypothetical protein
LKDMREQLHIVEGTHRATLQESKVKDEALQAMAAGYLLESKNKDEALEGISSELEKAKSELSSSMAAHVKLREKLHIAEASHRASVQEAKKKDEALEGTAAKLEKAKRELWSFTAEAKATHGALRGKLEEVRRTMEYIDKRATSLGIMSSRETPLCPEPIDDAERESRQRRKRHIMALATALKVGEVVPAPGAPQVIALGYGGHGTADDRNTGLMVVQNEEDDEAVVRLRCASSPMVTDLLLNPWDVCIQKVSGGAFFAAGACGGTSSQEEAGVADYDDEAWTQHQVAQGHGLVPGCTFESMLKTSAGFHRVLYIKGEKIFTHGAATIFDFESESDPNDSCQTFSLPELLKRIEKKKCHVLAPPSITGAKALEWLSQRLIPAVCPLAHVHKWLPEECLHIDFESGLMIVERHEQEEMAEALQRYAGLGFPTDTELVKVRIYGSVSRFFPCSALHLLGFLTFQERTEGQTFRSAPEDQQAPLKRGLSSVCSDEHQTTPSVSSRKRVRAEAEGCHIQ